MMFALVLVSLVSLAISANNDGVPNIPDSTLLQCGGLDPLRNLVDGDLVPNCLDLDADNVSIPVVIEGFSSALLSLAWVPVRESDNNR